MIVGIRYASYLISFIHSGVKEIDKTDTALDEIIPENVTEEIIVQLDENLIMLKLKQLLKNQQCIMVDEY